MDRGTWQAIVHRVARVRHDWSDLAHTHACPWLNWFTLHQTFFPGGSAGRESACNDGDLGSIPGLGRSPGEGNGYPLQYTGLENPMEYSPWGRRVRHDWATFTHTKHFSENTHYYKKYTTRISRISSSQDHTAQLHQNDKPHKIKMKDKSKPLLTYIQLLHFVV